MESPSSFIGFVINELRIARINLLAEANEVGVTLAALRSNLISVETACAHLDQLGLIPPSSAEAA